MIVDDDVEIGGSLIVDSDGDVILGGDGDMIVGDDGGGSEQPSNIMVIVVGAVLIGITVVVVIPAVVVKVMKTTRPPAVIPTEPSLGTGTDFAAMGTSFAISPPEMDDLPPPYPGLPAVVSAPYPGSQAGVSAPFAAQMETTLGLPEFPRQPSAVSLGETDMTQVPSLESFGEAEMNFPIPASPNLGKLPSLKTEESPKRKKKRRKSSIMETDLENAGKVPKRKRDKRK